MSLTLRFATENDNDTIYAFIRKMAQYEKLEREVDATPETLHESLFVQHQAEVILAEEDGEAVGFALFFHNFSTFRGRHGLYIEDIFVDQIHRGKGHGKILFKELARIAKARGCKRMEWVVLDWNAPSIAFYKSLGAIPMDEWTLYRLQENEIARLAE